MEQLGAVVSGICVGVGVFIPFQAGCHGQQVFDSDHVFFDISQAGIFREKIKYFLIHIRYETMVNGQTDQSRREALGDGCQIVYGFPVELGIVSVIKGNSRKIFFKYQLAVFDNQDAVDSVFKVVQKLIHEIRDRGFIQADFFQ